MPGTTAAGTRPTTSAPGPPLHSSARAASDTSWSGPTPTAGASRRSSGAHRTETKAPGDRGFLFSGEDHDMTRAPIKPPIAFAALAALDIRVGTIERVEEVAKSDKLLRLTVNFGDHA